MVGPYRPPAPGYSDLEGLTKSRWGYLCAMNLYTILVAIALIALIVVVLNFIRSGGRSI